MAVLLGKSPRLKLTGTLGDGRLSDINQTPSGRDIALNNAHT